MTSNKATADVMIVYEGGSGFISDFAYLTDDYIHDDARIRRLKVWYDEHTGEPDEVYRAGMIASINPATGTTTHKQTKLTQHGNTDENDTSNKVTADVIIIHEGGSESISDFVYLEEELDEDEPGNRIIKVWYDEHEGDADVIYRAAAIASINAATHRTIKEQTKLTQHGNTNEHETSTERSYDLTGITVEEIHREAHDVADSIQRAIDVSDADLTCSRCGTGMQWGRAYQLTNHVDRDALCQDCYRAGVSAQNGIEDREAFCDDVVAAIADLQDQAEAILAYADREDRKTWPIEETDEFRVFAGDVIQDYVNNMYDNAVAEAALQAFNAAAKRHADDLDQQLYYVLPNEDE